MNPDPPSPSDALDGQRALIGRLGPTSFPHPVEAITVIETHISFVVLTGPFAYKIKKALSLGFLDFGTLERRLFYCQEELRLNRRLAAPLYLDVVAIGGLREAPEVRGLQEAPQVGGPLPDLEYAVRMRQFEQAALFDTLLARGELEPSDIDALACLVADFHHRLPPAATPEETAHGTPPAVRAPMEDNFTAVRRLLGDTGVGSLLDEVEAWSRRRFEALETTLAGRHRGGFVRECHGDLHLGNIVRLDDGPCVFDGIEFNASLRWIDVASEIAFLVMDLWERGRRGSAFRFLNGYLERTGDYGGLEVLSFYLVYRAMVRAKIAAIRCNQPGLSPAERAAALSQAQAYLRYAQERTTPTHPVLVITHGFSGSGKTRASQSVVEAIGAIRLRSDVERKRLHGLAPLASSGSGVGAGIYDATASAATYARLHELAGRALSAGFSVVVDASFLRRGQRDQFRRLAAEHAVPWVMVRCEAPPSELYARVAARRQQGGDASEAGPEVLTRQFETAEPPGADEPSLALDEALEVLAAGGPGPAAPP